jgi:hypothetical protein
MPSSRNGKEFAPLKRTLSASALVLEQTSEAGIGRAVRNYFGLVDNLVNWDLIDR